MLATQALLIFGAGGHAGWVAAIAKANGYTPVLVDHDAEDETIRNTSACAAHVGIGDNAVRARVMASVAARRPDFQWPAIIAPTASVFGTVGPGALVLPGAVIGPSASVGIGCVLYTNSVCEHDSVMADYSSLAPGAVIGGNVQVGQRTFIGIGASVRHGARICADAVIGAGAVVVNHIDDPGVYVGAPARFMQPAHRGSALRPISQSRAKPRARPANQG